MSDAAETTPGAGDLLRAWRLRRRMTQLELSLRAEVSTRHLSFLETGRSLPSRAILLHLAEALDVPLRERNPLLVAAGYAPQYTERGLDAPAMRPVRAALDRLLAAHEPYPAAVVDRWWNLVAANASLAVLTEGVAAELLVPPVNVLRVSLHPDGLAPRVRNLGEWGAHLFWRLRRDVDRTGDPRLVGLLEELQGYAGGGPTSQLHQVGGVVVPLRLAHPDGELSLLSTVATFGTAADVTVADLSIEAFYPADEASRGLLERSSTRATGGS